MVARIQQCCTVHSCQEVAENTFLLRFVSEEIASSAKPGQFVNILPSGNGSGLILRRPFSISRIEKNILDVLFHAIGPGTKLLSRKLPGDRIDVLGPLGQPFHGNAEFTTAFIVAGGIGVAPFPFLTEELLNGGKQVETFVGYRTVRQAYTSNLQHLHLATDDGTGGFHGNVIQLLESSFAQDHFGKIKIFGCGPTVMLKALSEFAARKQVCCELSLEGQMACGFGICQGCAVERSDNHGQYALVCKDGPVFQSTEVNL